VSAALATTALPEHLAPLPDPQWAVWRWTQLRGTGLPVELLTPVASPGYAASARDVLGAERELAAARDHAQQHLRAAAPHLPPDAALRKRLRAVQRAVGRDGGDPAAGPALARDLAAHVPGPLAAAALAAAHRYATARTALAERLATLRDAHADAVNGEAAELRAALRDPRMAEAMLWQNRAALHRVSRRLRPDEPVPAGRRPNDRERADLRLVLSYLQRYCAKNDTIGFFGPVAWFTLADGGPRLSARPGPGLLAARTVRWETWGLEALADVLATDPRLLPWLVPQRTPLAHLTATAAHQPFSPPTPLGPATAAVLALCDGSRRTDQIAESLHTTLPAVCAALRELTTANLIDVGLPVPLGLHPERALRRQLDRVRPEALRTAVLAPLDRLLAAGAAVAAAGRDLPRLGAALDGLDDTFTAVTARAASRGQGQMYAARALVYEECRRDVDLHLSTALLDEIGTPLALILTSARWLGARLVRTAEVVLRRTYARLAAGGRPVPLADLWLAAQGLLFDPDRKAYGPAITEFHRRWATILPATTPGAAEISATAADLAPAVHREFGGVVAPVRALRYYSPDVMVAASDTDAVERGDYLAVLGELHMARNTLAASSFAGEHPQPDALAAAWRSDLGDGYEHLAPSREWGFTARTAPAVSGPADRELLIARDSRALRPDRALLLGDFTVSDQDGTLVATHRDGRYRRDVLELLGDALAPIVTDAFHIAPAAAHRPRIRIDRLVVARRGWQVNADELAFAAETDPAARFLAAQRLWAARGMPRRVFVRAPGEPKPVYLDADSVTGIDLLARMVRAGGGPVACTELLPALDQLWYAAADGSRHTTEFRFVMVDRAASATPG
jgi:hypothetical protein